MTSEPPVFDFTAALPTALTALQASAGTGKTYALCALAVRYVAEAGVNASQLCIVSFTESATAELRSRVRDRLVGAAEHLERGATGSTDALLTHLAMGTEAQLAERRRRLRTAVNEFDAATVSTIHGFCMRVLASGVATTTDADLDGDTRDLDEVVHDVLLRRFGDAPPGRSFVKRVGDTISARLRLPAAELWVGEPVDGVPSTLDPELAARARRIADTVDEMAVELRRRRQAGRRRSFDDLLVDALDTLRAPRGAAVVAALRAHYKVVLIDEFQDTDTVQWNLFRTAFVDKVAGGPDPCAVVLVGDPKQAIYRFRGAELSAYLAAVESAGPRRARLDTNFRSDPPLLTGLAHLLRGTTFGADSVAFEEVHAPKHHVGSAITGVAGAPVQIRCVDDAPNVPVARRLIVADVVGQVAALLAGGVQVGRGSPGDPVRPLRPRDIAVLTRANRDAVRIAKELGTAGVPAATATANSVLQTRAATQWRVLLAALERPGSAGTARAAALGWFLGYTGEQVAALDDAGLAELHATLHRWSELLLRRGLPHLLAAARTSGLHGRLLSRRGGERDLTDLEHVAEVLHDECGGRPVGAAVLLDLLREVAEAEDAVAGDRLARRIDRDDDAVQVLTIHRAKGLEFPVVLCPFLWTKRASGHDVPHAFVGGRRLIDVVTTANLGRPAAPGDTVYLADGKEQDDEALRLLYVALTRAQHRAVVWWAPQQRSDNGPLGRVLERVTGVAKPDLAALQAWALPRRGAVEAVRVEPSPEVAPPVGAPTPLTSAACGFVHDWVWRRWSYSAIAADLAADLAADTAGDTAAGTAGSTVAVVPAIGGTDEGAADEPALPVVIDPWEGLPAGTAFGTLVHSLLESCDFTSPTLAADLHAACIERVRRGATRADPAVLADRLHAVVHARLGGPVGAVRLADLPRAARRDELRFDMALGRFPAAAVGEVLAAHLPASDPFLPWATALAGSGAAVVDGMLNGSIDLVSRSDNRYWVADYKTNRLPSGYAEASLVGAMEHHHYPLQAAVYLVALHRYLRWRLAAYRPEHHLAGAAYLFVRGMHHSAPDGHGVMWWCPPADAVVALDRLFATGGGA